MYSLRFSKTYGFGIVEKNNLKQVLEDKFYADDKMFCIADGVTRDLPDGTTIHYPNTKEEAEELIKKYPNPSGAALAAEICVKDIVNYLKKENFEEKDFIKVVSIANADIKKINYGRKINYTSEDAYCCTSVGGIISDDYLYCFSIGDSCIKVVDENYNEIFDSMDDMKQENGLIVNSGRKLFKNVFNWKNKLYRIYVRKYRRNNLWLKLTGRNNVGVLDGNKNALKFVRNFKVPLKEAKYILAFSDGCLEAVNTKEKIKKVIENPNSIKEIIEEKTLIIYEKN